ncbi:hypothetical protein COLO4_04395 [Corchorus olitorius]|uniref:Uncharacterized protein n=1 Tax=Corchorus olitorius TaxID=93759 RepID=A0A1R3KU93_9ROSI|nr:hypothetical protein COLO4_04395 [Corchorus olitorius]
MAEERKELAYWIRKYGIHKQNTRWWKNNLDEVRTKNDMEIDQQVKILCNNLKRLREENGEVREECKREKKKVRAVEESKAFLESRIKTLREATQINKKEYDEMEKTLSKL